MFVVKIAIVQVARARVRGRLWPVAQTGLAAVAAWYLAVLLGVDSRPGFASIAAVISLGAAFGERRQRAVQLIVHRYQLALVVVKVKTEEIVKWTS